MEVEMSASSEVAVHTTVHLCPRCSNKLLPWHRILSGGECGYGFMCYNSECKATSAWAASVEEALALLKEEAK